MANSRKLNMESSIWGNSPGLLRNPRRASSISPGSTGIELASQNGLKVILCTPSATPPVWLSRRHPEILMVDSAGRTINHGSREQGDWSSPVYREYVSKIDSELAKRYGNDKPIWGWQIDN